MKKTIITLITIIITLTTAAQQNIRYYNQHTDTTKINQLLQQATQIPDNNSRIINLALQLLDTPYIPATLEHNPETLTINLSQLDCTTLIDNILALAKTAAQPNPNLQQFIHNLTDMRYRDGKINGYTSRLHYITDWAHNNIRRHNLIETTAQTPGATYHTISLNYMTEHPNLYSQLADTANLAQMQQIENQYHNYTHPIIPIDSIPTLTPQTLRTGDIIAITTSIPGLDVTHLAIIIYPQDIPNTIQHPTNTTSPQTPYIIHASSKAKKVIISHQPLHDYLRQSPRNTGIRIFRLPD